MFWISVAFVFITVVVTKPVTLGILFLISAVFFIAVSLFDPLTSIRHLPAYIYSLLSVASQQTFVLMKTSWRSLSSSSSEDVLIKTNMFALALRLQKTSWSRPIYSSWPYVFKTSSRRLQDIFKTSSRHLQDVFKTSCKDIFKMFSRRIIKLNCSC